MAEVEPESGRLSVRETRERLMRAALAHIPGGGFTDRTFRLAAMDAGVELARARIACPRGSLDIAWDFQAAGDERMLKEAGKLDFSALRFRDRISEMVFLRLKAMEGSERIVERCMSLYALPQHALEGGRAVWATADRIWTRLGDSSEDMNWYTKRASLSAVIGSATLHWIGDSSSGNAETRQFIDRRIGDVMEFEKVKAAIRSNPACRPVADGFDRFAQFIRAPRNRHADWPGSKAEENK